MSDSIRQDFAKQYLSETDFRLEQIAYLNGYSEPAALVRAFKRNDPYAVPGETRLTAAPRRLTPTVIVGRRRSMPVSVESTISLWNAHGTHHGGCHGYGLMHLPEPATALREILRVLRPGGRAALSVWDAAGVGFALVYEAVRARGSMDVALPHGPDFFQFGSTERMRAALQEAGFADAAAYSFPQNWHVANTDRYIEAILTGTVRARAVLAAQSANAAAGVRSYIADYLTRFRASAGGFVVPMPAIVGSGARPG